jgi:glutathione S-transferase
LKSAPILWHAPQTRSETTLWMDEELSRVCDIKILKLREGAGREPAFLKINPMGKVPALEHGGVVVTETAAICAYLADMFPKARLAPSTDDPKRGAYYRWLFFAPSVIEPAMLDKLGGMTRANMQAAGHGEWDRVLAAIDSALVNADPWLLGEQFTAADVVFGAALNWATMFGAIPKEGRIKAYVERVTARPAFISAAARSATFQ